MRKLITDFDKCGVEGENNNKSLVCSQVEAGKAFANQLLCCEDDKCDNDLKKLLELWREICIQMS
jgi:hypothetical protein